MPAGQETSLDAQQLCQGQSFGEQLRDVQKLFYESEFNSGACKVSLTKGVLKAWGRPARGPESVLSSEPTGLGALPGAVEAGSVTASPEASDVPSIFAASRNDRRASSASKLSQGLRRGLDSLQIETATDTPKEKQRYGPERFFYDQRTYTGVHKTGPPTTVEKEVVTQILRDPSPRSRSASVASLSPRARASTSMTPRASGVFTSFKLVSPAGDSPRRRTVAGETAEDSNRYGPERFFYDQRTYTGTHRNGGPEITETAEPQLRRSSTMMTPQSQRGSTVSLASEPGSAPLRSPTGPRGTGKRLDFSSQDETKEPQSTRSMRSLHSFQSQGSLTSAVSPRNRAATETPRSTRSASVAFKDSFRYGPERFFYDSRTYTGVHKNGGPATIDLPEAKAASPRADSTRSRAWSSMSSRSLGLDA